MLRFPMILTISIPLLGCFRPPEPTPPPIEAPLFCDLVTEDYQWTQAEWDERVARYPANLRREIQSNQHRARECPRKGKSDVE